MRSLVTALFSVAAAQLCVAEALAQSRAEVARASPRIINGVAVLPGQGGWAVSLRRPITSDPASRTHYCGGSFVAPRYNLVTNSVAGWSPSERRPQWVLTAAHCVVTKGTKTNEADLRVLGGTIDLSSAVNGEEQQVERIIIHPDYNEHTLENDIALLKLREPAKDIPITLRVSIRLPSIADVSWIAKPYLAVRAQGWGRTERGYQSPTLLEVMIPLVDRQTCRTVFEPNGERIPDGAICGGFVSGDFDSCQGDSGGPLIYRSQSSAPSPGFAAEPTLVGVISWGIGCGLADLYGVYTSAMSYRRWAEEAVVAYHAGK
jgi:secreted trypsin-like serine protease